MVDVFLVFVGQRAAGADLVDFVLQCLGVEIAFLLFQVYSMSCDLCVVSGALFSVILSMVVVA